MRLVLFSLIAAQSWCVAAICLAGEGSAVLPNPAISATVTVECARPEGRRVLTSRGTGTLIAPDLVLTCSHDTYATDEITVRSGGRDILGRLAAVDRRADAAVIRLASPLEGVQPVRVSTDVSEALETAGVGGAGFQWRQSEFLRWYPLHDGRHSFAMTGVNRPGDSGAGVFNDRRQLVGVAWGSNYGETFVTAGEPLITFLKRALGPEYHTVVELAE